MAEETTSRPGTEDATSTASLAPGQSATVFSGSENQTFDVQLIGTITRTAELRVRVDGSVAAVLTPNARRTRVNGRTIAVENAGRENQAFVATPV